MSSVFDPGKEDREAARIKGDAGIIKGGAFSGPGGLSGDFNFAGGRGASNFGLGSFQNQLDMFQQMSAAGGAQAQAGLPPELRALGENTIGQLGTGQFDRFINESNFNALGDIFNESSSLAMSDPFELGAGVSEKLRALSDRRNRRLVNSTFDRLKASGKLGTTGGAGIAAGLDANLFDEGLKFDLAGLEAGRGLQSDAISRIFGSAGLREQIGARQFGEDMGVAQYGDNAALQQFGVGSDMFRQFMANQAQGAQLATLGAQGAQGVAQMPLAFQQMMMAANAQASNSQFASAGIDQQNAAMAQSPLLNALTTAGSLAGSLSGAGLLGTTIAERAGIAAGTN